MRVFFLNDLGIYSFFNFIVIYFFLLVILGVVNYGIKEIFGDWKIICKNFWGIYIL